MAHPALAQVKEWLKQNETELLNNYQALLRIPSVESEAAPNAPFGEANREALDFMLDLAQQWGMKTKDMEGFCGYAEFGSGEKMIAMIGHLDVVPVGPGWKYEPFDATIDNGYVYSRGSCDDKGPTIAAFYAARAVKEVLGETPVRIRSIFGCDEESGFECIHHYNKTEEQPTFGFAPDAGWPLIHAEKGIANLIIHAPLYQGEMTLLSVEGGQRPNIVIDSCIGKVRVAQNVKAAICEAVDKYWDRNVEFTWLDDATLQVEAIGKAAHGSTPFEGDNAATRVFRVFNEIAPIADRDWYDFLMNTAQTSGAGLGINGEDEVSKDLTSNLGIVETINGALKLTVNVRYPVTWKGDHLRSLCIDFLKEAEYDFSLADFTDSESLYFPLEHPLVKAVCDVYAEETGDTKRKPGVMGGGTYARAVKNSVAIGAGFIGDGDAHQVDEKMAISSLYKLSQIYAHLFLQLIEIAK